MRNHLNGKIGSGMQTQWMNGVAEYKKSTYTTRAKIYDLYLLTIFYFPASTSYFNYILINRFEMNSMVRTELADCKNTDCSLFTLQCNKWLLLKWNNSEHLVCVNCQWLNMANDVCFFFIAPRFIFRYISSNLLLLYLFLIVSY